MKGFYIVLGVSIVSLIASPVFAADSIAQVVWVKGALKATQPEQAVRVLARRSPVFKQDTVTTDATSSGQLVFTDNTVLAVRENTSLVLSQYQYGKSTPPKEGKFVADLAKGGFRTITGAIAKENPDGYQTHTPVATIGVSGTGFNFYYDPVTGKLSVDCQIGVCTVSNQYGKQILNKNSRFATVNKGEAPKTVATMPPELKNSPKLEKTTYDSNLAPATVTGGGTTPPSEGGSETSSGTESTTTSGEGGSETGSGTESTTTSGEGEVKELKALNMPCP